MPMQEQTRLRSPYTLSTRPTLGQNLLARVKRSGKAAVSREYGRFHSSEQTTFAVWGACLRGLLALSDSPLATACISPWIEIIASQKRSSSAFDSLSVGSIISVPGTGNDIVGAW